MISLFIENSNSKDSNIWALQSLFALIPFQIEVIQLMIQRNFISTIVKLILSLKLGNSEQSLEPLLVTLCYICVSITSSKEGKDQLYLMNATSVFYDLIEKYIMFDRICNYACSVISNLFVGSDSVSKNRINPEKFVEILIKILDIHRKKSSVVESAICALGNITCHIYETTDFIGDLGGIKLIEELLSENLKSNNEDLLLGLGSLICNFKFFKIRELVIYSFYLTKRSENDNLRSSVFEQIGDGLFDLLKTGISSSFTLNYCLVISLANLIMNGSLFSSHFLENVSKHKIPVKNISNLLVEKLGTFKVEVSLENLVWGEFPPLFRLMDSQVQSSRFVGLFAFCHQSNVQSKRRLLLHPDGILVFQRSIREALTLDFECDLFQMFENWISFAFENFIKDESTNEILQIHFGEYFKYFYTKK
jgi:hypothetical protein